MKAHEGCGRGRRPGRRATTRKRRAYAPRTLLYLQLTGRNVGPSRAVVTMSIGRHEHLRRPRRIVMHPRATDKRRANGVGKVSVPLMAAALRTKHRAQPPITRAVTLAYVASLVMGVLVALVSVIGTAFGSLYSADPATVSGITAS